MDLELNALASDVYGRSFGYLRNNDYLMFIRSLSLARGFFEISGNEYMKDLCTKFAERLFDTPSRWLKMGEERAQFFSHMFNDSSIIPSLEIERLEKELRER